MGTMNAAEQKEILIARARSDHALQVKAATRRKDGSEEHIDPFNPESVDLSKVM